MSDKREIEKKLKANGFVIRRKATHGVFWEKGGARVMVPLTPSDGRWIKNCNADIERILRADPKHVQLEIKPIAQKLETAQIMTPRRHTKTELIKIDSLVSELVTMGKNNGEIAVILNSQGIKKSSGDPIDGHYVGLRKCLIKQMKAALVSAPAALPVAAARVASPTPVPATIPAPVVAPVYQFNKKLNDTVMALLTDPCLTDKQKVRMLLAYGEE